MNVKIEPAVSIMAIVTDKKEREASVFDVDTIKLTMLNVQCTPDRIAQIFFSVGCVDHKGKFHVSPEHQELSSGVKLDLKAFDKYFIDENGSFKIVLTEDEVYNMYKDYVPYCNKGSFKFENAKFTLGEEVIFTDLKG